MSGLEPYAPSVDGQVEPQGVIHSPRFGWKLRADHRGARQLSYRVRVWAEAATEEDFLVWDSGRVESDEQLSVLYAGAPIMSSTRYNWAVDVEDERGRTVRTRSQFGTGIVHAQEWRAGWIARNPIFTHVALPPQDTDISYTVNKLQPVRRFVHHFELAAVPRRARVHASAQGAYRLYINGHRVGDDELVPGWTEYRERITYQSWEVSDLLRPGRNSIAALLADGWYTGFIGTDRRHHAQHYGTQPSFLAQLVLDDDTGLRRVVASDASWRESASEILYADMLMGQYEDSRRAEPDWNLPSFDISSWATAVVASEDTSLLTPEVDPAVRAMEVVGARSVTRLSENRLIVDFGQNLVGRVRFTARGQAGGTRLQLRHAEVVTESGELYTENLRTAEPVDVFWTDGQPAQVFEPRFTLHGFRFVELSGLEGTISVDDIEAIVLHNAFERTGEFETSSADINQLASNIWWSLRGNFVSIPTDCPQRDERLGWLADAQVFAPTALAFADVGPLLSRWLRDVRSAQSEEGAFPDIAPHLIHLREGAPAWGDGGVTVPWNIYRATGAVSVLTESVDSMIAWVRYVERHNPGLIWRERVGNNYGDWLQLGEETRKDVLATAYFAHSADLTSRTLHVLGRRDEARAIGDLAARIREAFTTEFVADDGTIAGDTQGAYLLAIAFDLCPEHLAPKLAERLVETVTRRAVTLTTGFVTVGLLCPVLTRIGRPDLALQLLHSDRYPSWLFSVRNGATTIWERWDGWTPENGFQSARMNSFNHYSLGSVGEWLFSGLGGIAQEETSAGFSAVLLQPLFDPQLDWVSSSRDTQRGQIASRWRRSAGQIDWTVSVPPGTNAMAVLPINQSAQLTEGGEHASNSEGVEILSTTEHETTISLKSGSYNFRFNHG